MLSSYKYGALALWLLISVMCLVLGALWNPMAYASAALALWWGVGGVVGYIAPDELPASNRIPARILRAIHKPLHQFFNRRNQTVFRRSHQLSQRLLRNRPLLREIGSEGFRTAELVSRYGEPAESAKEVRSALQDRGLLSEALTADGPQAERDARLILRGADTFSRLWPFLSGMFRCMYALFVFAATIKYMFESAIQQLGLRPKSSPREQTPAGAHYWASIEPDTNRQLFSASFDDFPVSEAEARRWNPRMRELAESVLVHLKMGRFTAAMNGMLVANNVLQANLEDTFLISDDERQEEHKELLHFWKGIAFLILSQENFEPEREQVRALYTHLLRTKAIDIDLLALRHRNVTSSPNWQQLLKAIRPSLQDHINASTASVNHAGLERDSWRTRRLRARYLLSEIGMRLAVGFGLGFREINKHSWERDVGALPLDAVLLDIYRYTPVDLVKLRRDPIVDYDKDQYFAFVMRGREIAHFVLDDADLVDSLVREYVSVLGGEQHDAIGRNVPAVAPRDRNPQSLADIGKILGERLLEPFSSIVESANHLVVSADGELLNLPFETLPIGDQPTAIDRLLISYVESPRDLALWLEPAGKHATPPCVIGDPDYGHIDGPGFVRLPATVTEAKTVARLLGVDPIVGVDASEASVKKLKSPRVLHLATHGYYFSATTTGQRDVVDGRSGAAIQTMSKLENPLLRSGIALAGANTWLSGERLHRNVEDGLLTAEDVLEMDLVGTELVVLSACQTALGEARAGHGIFGLRRTFSIAGARSLVVSLWEVPDAPTRMLMGRFYRYLTEGKGRADALRRAKLDLRPVYPHPMNWAGFVCLGYTGPLQLDTSNAQRHVHDVPNDTPALGGN